MRALVRTCGATATPLNKRLPRRLCQVSREIDEHQFEADMVAMLNAAPTIMQTGAL